MIQSELVEYIAKAKAEGHDLKTVKSVLQQQGWSEEDINESLVAATMPSAPAKKEQKLQAPSHKQSRQLQVPDYYISPISTILSIVLIATLVTLTGRIIGDIEDIIAPYAASGFYETTQYQQLLEKHYPNTIPAPEVEKIRIAYNDRHDADSVTHLFVVGIVSALFWGVAFLVHFSLAKSHRQYLPLSVPYFLTAGLYLVIALFEIILRLFDNQAQMAVYVMLFLFIAVVTTAFIFYQKRSHAEKQL